MVISNDVLPDQISLSEWFNLLVEIIVFPNLVSHFVHFLNCSVGFPYKEAVVQFCDEVHPLAKVI